MTLAEMERKIKSLEKRVKELEGENKLEVQVHYLQEYNSFPLTPPRVNPYDPFGPGTIIC